MKKRVLLLLGFITFATTSFANNNFKSTSKIGVNSRYNDAISFVEKGVKFHVFLNGDFDFNTHFKNTRYYDYNGRRTRVNRGGVRIERDHRGRVRRVGNSFINYDRRGNVKRIGSVFIDYRYGQMTKVGHLRIRYDRWGNPRFIGNVKHNHYYDDVYYNDYDVNVDINIGDVCDYDDVYFYRRDFRRNYRQFREDNNFYYYRAVPNAKIGKRSKIIKRRKPRKTKKYNNDDLYYKKESKKGRNSNRR